MATQEEFDAMRKECAQECITEATRINDEYAELFSERIINL